MSVSTIFREEQNCWTKLAVSIAQSSCEFWLNFLLFIVKLKFFNCQIVGLHLELYQKFTSPLWSCLLEIHRRFRLKTLQITFWKMLWKRRLIVFRTLRHSPHEKVALPFSLTSWEYSIYCGVAIKITMTLLTSWKWWKNRLLDRDIYHIEQLEAIWQTDPGDYDK